MTDIVLAICLITVSAFNFVMFLALLSESSKERKDIINRLEAKNIAEYERLSSSDKVDKVEYNNYLSAHSRAVNKWKERGGTDS